MDVNTEWWLDPAWRWQRLGGGGVIVIGVLNLVAVVARAGDLGALNIAVVAISTVVSIMTGWALAFGSSGSNGIVGDSRPGKVGIMVYGFSSALNVASVDPDSPLAIVSAVGSLLGAIGLIVALVQISKAGIADRRSRRAPLWFVLASVGAAILAVIVHNITGVPTATAGIIVALAGAIAQANVGLAYLRNPLVAESEEAAGDPSGETANA